MVPVVPLLVAITIKLRTCFRVCVFTMFTVATLVEVVMMDSVVDSVCMVTLVTVVTARLVFSE